MLATLFLTLIKLCSAEVLWSQTSNPTPFDDTLTTIAISEDGVFVAGRAGYATVTGSPSVAASGTWRIEKRDPQTGRLVESFGTRGVVELQVGITSHIMAMQAVKNELLIAGFYKTDQGLNTIPRLEKRDATSGQLIAHFGNQGEITTEWGPSLDSYTDIAIYDNILYLIGYQTTRTLSRFRPQWRMEKRDLSTGGTIADFGNAGLMIYQPLQGASNVGTKVAADSSGVYFVGSVFNGAQARILKFDHRGKLIESFGTKGMLVVAGQLNWPHSIIRTIKLQQNSLYTVHADQSQAGWESHIEKRNPLSGELITTFGTKGLLPFAKGYLSASAFVAHSVVGAHCTSVDCVLSEVDLDTGVAKAGVPSSNFPIAMHAVPHCAQVYSVGTKHEATRTPDTSSWIEKISF